MKIKTGFILLLALFAASCSLFNSHSIHSRIVGKWEWLRSVGGFAGWTITPDSEGSSKYYITFRSDRRYTMVRADTVVRSGTYSIKNNGGKAMITYGSVKNSPFNTNQYIDFRTDDTLILTDDCADCYISTYKRVR